MGFFSRKNKEKKPRKSELKNVPAEPILEDEEKDALDAEAQEIADEILTDHRREVEAETEVVDSDELDAMQEEARALARMAAREAAREDEPQKLTLTIETDEDEEEDEPEDEEESESDEEKLGSEEEESAPDATDEDAPKKGLFARLKQGLRKTKDAMLGRVRQVLGGFTKIDDDLFDALEETLILSDLGPETSMQICDKLRERVKEENVTDPNAITGMMQDILLEMLGCDETIAYPTVPTVVLVIGVNGAGKTTTIGKMCYQLKGEGKRVLVAAADTFRAAAIDQLEDWTERAGVELIKHQEGADPGAVVFDAIEAAKARKCDVLICDTAGRLHNKKNLMQELGKINRIIASKAEGCHIETLLVLDATTGQNAVNQARLFQEVAPITGIVLTKLDGTAKGGIVITIKNELGIPVKLIGVGEKIEDLQPFCGADFVHALFSEEENA